MNLDSPRDSVSVTKPALSSLSTMILTCVGLPVLSDEWSGCVSRMSMSPLEAAPATKRNMYYVCMYNVCL